MSYKTKQNAEFAELVYLDSENTQLRNALFWMLKLAQTS